MSCDVALAAYLFLASTSPAGPAPQAAPPSVASEPLFADIVGRAGRLKSEVDAYRETQGLKAASARIALPGMERFEKDVQDLAALDMQGHVELAKRGTDGDLKCILKGISQDLPVKLRQLEQASTGAAEDTALRDMAYLLNDNVEVITAPPAPPV
jgi:hypothetical protein